MWFDLDTLQSLYRTIFLYGLLFDEPLITRHNIKVLPTMTSSSWPWMNDAPVAIADPIDPINEYDVRPSVKDLIAQNRKSIDKAKAILEHHTLFHSQKHDDLWILRFCLSHKKTKDAVKAAQHALVFREEHQLDFKDIRYHPVAKGGVDLPEEVTRYLCYCTNDALQWALPDPRRGVISFLNFAGIDQHALVKNLDEKDWLPSFLYFSEWSFQWLDYVTRVTGRLTKSVRLIDLQEVKLSAISTEGNKRDGAAMGVMEDVYPQVLKTLYLCHAPSWVQIPWRILRPLMPKRVVDKMDFINPDKKPNERKRLLEHMDESHIPVRFGGTYEARPVAFPLPEH
jgi:hypothetical protein